MYEYPCTKPKPKPYYSMMPQTTNALIEILKYGTFFIIAIQQLPNIEFMNKFNIFSEQYVIPSEYNKIIDILLSNQSHCVLGKRTIITPNRYGPDFGKHTYYANPSNDLFNYYNNLNYVVFDKQKFGKNNEIIEYTVNVNFFIKYFAENALDHAMKKIFYHDENTIQSISIDSSQFTISTFIVNRLYKFPTIVQSKITDWVIINYERTLSTKVLVTGRRGIGKSYLAYIIKRAMDNQYNVDCKLFDDVNPATVGLNIKSKILSLASEFNPVIIVINEFDIVLDKVVQNKQYVGDSRLVHTENKLTFNQLLDDIGLTQHVIAVYTTEKSVDELKLNSLYTSFLRKGRIDVFVTMGDDYADFVESDNL